MRLLALSNVLKRPQTVDLLFSPHASRLSLLLLRRLPSVASSCCTAPTLTRGCAHHTLFTRLSCFPLTDTPIRLQTVCHSAYLTVCLSLVVSSIPIRVSPHLRISSTDKNLSSIPPSLQHLRSPCTAVSDRFLHVLESIATFYSVQNTFWPVSYLRLTRPCLAHEAELQLNLFQHKLYCLLIESATFILQQTGSATLDDGNIIQAQVKKEALSNYAWK